MYRQGSAKSWIVTGVVILDYELIFDHLIFYLMRGFWESCSKKARDDLELIADDISIVRQFVKILTSEANICRANQEMLQN
jgi:hypothetical protein